MPSFPSSARSAPFRGGMLAILCSGTAFAAVPPVPTPPGNPVTAEKAVLGKILFWDEQLSTDNTVACGTCHQPNAGSSDPRGGVHPGPDGIFMSPDDVFGSLGVPAMDVDAVAVDDASFGFGPQVTDRSSPTFLGSLWAPELFWDGRAPAQFLDPETGAVSLNGRAALESQAVAPLLNTVEMAHEGRTWNDLIGKLEVSDPLALATNLPADVSAALAVSPTYGDLFRDAFGDDQITADRIGRALATYERTLIADQTPWDAFDAGDMTALTPGQVRGLNAFRNTTCDVCHVPPLFTDNTFRNIGLAPVADDAGRQNVTGNPADRGRFKVPSLRNVSLKTEFMHNGRLRTLQQVVDFYLRQGPMQFPDNRDPLIGQIDVPPPEVGPLVDFLTNALTDPRVAAQAPPFDRPTLHARPNACSDGLDNDGDGLTDLADGGCADPSDTAETAFDQICDDGLDNDGDGLRDAADTDCDGDGGYAPLLDVSPVSAGGPFVLTATELAPGSRVLFFVSLRGEGIGPCHPTVDVCADVRAPITVGRAIANASGVAQLGRTAPPNLVSGSNLWFQAIMLDGGEGYASNVVNEIVLP